MRTFESLWPKFRLSKKYRDAFVAQHAKTEIGVQIRALLKQHNLTQAQLAERGGITQGVVSRAADPAYGKLTINTLVRIAAGFDVAFVGRFVPFSELPKWFDKLSADQFRVPTFAQEDAAFEHQSQVAATEQSPTPSALLDDAVRRMTRQPIVGESPLTLELRSTVKQLQEVRAHSNLVYLDDFRKQQSAASESLQTPKQAFDGAHGLLRSTIPPVEEQLRNQSYGN